MKSILRQLLFIPSPKIGAKEALKIAFEVCEKNGQPWDPEIIEGLKNWTVWTPKNSKGAAQIIIDQQTGHIIRFVTLPR